MICSVSLQAQVITPEHEAKAVSLVKQMTLDEKLEYIGGYNSFYLRAIPRLGIPEIWFADGPQGIRIDSHSTLFPSGMALAATWDRSLAYKTGEGIGQDARARGIHVMMGPGVNIYRSPVCGRNFEYYGEDPYLAGEMAAAYIEGMQDMGVMACMKHFAANNQEYDRHHVSADIDERTLNEIYLPAFEKGVRQANVGMIMDCYGLVNGRHGTENSYLNIDVLRDRWGFKGIVTSDWEATYTLINGVYNGLDIEMPRGWLLDPAKMKELIGNGVIDERVIDEKVQHILQSLLAFGFFDRPQKDESISERNPYSDSVALEVARGGIVMLKNDGILPLEKGKVLVCGPNANTIVTGGGSGVVYPFESCSVAEGMRNMGRKYRSLYDTSGWETDLSMFYADKDCTIPGAFAEFFSSKDLSGEPVHTAFVTGIDSTYAASPVPGVVPDDYSDRYTFYYRPEKESYLYLSAGGDDGYRLLIDGETVIDDWENKAFRSKDIIRRFEAGKVYRFTYEHTDDWAVSQVLFRYSDQMNDPAFAKALDEADAVIACVGFDSVTEHEGGDRTFSLPDGQTDLLDALLERNSNVIVVLNAGGGVDMTPWLDRVRAVIMAWYPGQQGGQAVAEILTGKISPSGKLPFTIEKRLEDNPTYGSYHTNVDMSMFNTPYKRVEYNEGIFVGYRGYERNGIEPLFPFGYGLSYSRFEYANLSAEEDGGVWTIAFDVTNTGDCDAAEVAQVYVSDLEASVPRPVKELKGYEKIFLKKGQTKRVEIELGRDAFSYYDAVERHGFVVEPGRFEVLVGASSEDIRLRTGIDVPAQEIL